MQGLIMSSVVSKLKMIKWGVAKLVKAHGFDPCIPRFESSHPSHIFLNSLDKKATL